MFQVVMIITAIFSKSVTVTSVDFKNLSNCETAKVVVMSEMSKLSQERYSSGNGTMTYSVTCHIK
jgi:hypothetical protein